MPSLGDLVLEWCFAWPNFLQSHRLLVDSNDLGPCNNLESRAKVADAAQRIIVDRAEFRPALSCRRRSLTSRRVGQ